MNILHINQSDISGGAAIAAYRLHQGLLNENVGSRLLVGKAHLSNPLVNEIPSRKIIEQNLLRLTYRLGLNYINLLGAFNIPSHPFFQEADIINFHNLHSGAFNYLALPLLANKKPSVFTLHDMWGFTGHCAYSYDCDRWKHGCGKCPYLNSYPGIQKDNTQWEWKMKNWVYGQARLTIITPSHWLTEQAGQSMLNRFEIHHVPNGVDLTTYSPIDPQRCRFLLGIPSKKNVLMFSADNLKDDRKGGSLLLKALSKLPRELKNEIVLLVLGRGGEIISKTVEINTLNLGYVESDRLKAIAYSASDLFIFPTRADNLPLVLQESMACGTPMISFKIGGVPDLVRHGVTGYLAEPEDVNDLMNGIIQLLESHDLRESMSRNCRTIAVNEYSLKLQTKRYLKIYQKVLSP